jgi:restriction system protein
MSVRTYHSSPVSSRTLAFERPLWRPRQRLVIYTLAALTISGFWLLSYAWLGYRLWVLDAPLTRTPTLANAAALVVVGVAILLAWWEILRQWRLQLRPTAWRALSLAQMQALTPSQFEDYVGQRLFARQGYQVVNTPDARDGGIDVLLTDDTGQLAVVQCKRYRGTVGEEVVRDLYGTMIHSGASHAYLVTTGAISADARRWAAQKPIELIDGKRLVDLARSLAHLDHRN